MPYPHVDSQAGNEYAGWQILAAAVKATNSLDDKTIAEWLDKNSVETIEGKRDFSGRSHTAASRYAAAEAGAGRQVGGDLAA